MTVEELQLNDDGSDDNDDRDDHVESTNQITNQMRLRKILPGHQQQQL